MTNKIQVAFTQYTEKLKNLIQRVAILPGKDKKRHLVNLVEKIEEEPEFHGLVQATRAEFDHIGDLRNKSAWRRAVGNVLRRSGFYINMLEKKLYDVSAEFEKYIHAFKSSERKISYLALLEYVSFEQDDIDCGHFQIKRFSRDELDAVLGNSINEIFYPWAAVELKEIKDYWFIYIEQTGPAPEIGCSPFLDFDLSSDDIYRVKMRYSPLSEPVESVIKPLVLFDWQTDYWRREPADEKEEKEEKATGWIGFSIPFVLKVTDKLYEQPFPSPSLEKLDKKIEFVTEDGEEIWGPEVHISLDQQKTELFIAFVKRTHENLQKLDFEESGWLFFEIALNMLVKAFFSGGLEQLLWHITAIDALLGERGGGLTKKLARRIAAILGETEDKQKELGECFIALYDFRSELIHGREFNSQIYLSHLREARDFARQTLIWFLNKLATIQNKILEGKDVSKYPGREFIIEDIDGKSCWKPLKNKR